MLGKQKHPPFLRFRASLIRKKNHKTPKFVTFPCPLLRQDPPKADLTSQSSDLMVFEMMLMSLRGVHPTDCQKVMPSALLLNMKMWAF